MLERNYTVCRLIALASLLLAACNVHMPSSLAIYQTSPVWHSHQQLVSALTCYQIGGALAYLSKEQKVYVRFHWQQTSADLYRLIIINPLGNTEMNIHVQSGVVQIVNSQGKSYRSDDPELMVKKLTGMYIPLNELRQWMLGLPGDAVDYMLDCHGYLYQLNFNHNGQLWTVTYQNYNNDMVPALPSKLELHQGNNCIKLKIDSWSWS